MKRWQRHMLFWFGVYLVWMYMKTFGYIDLSALAVNIIHVSAYMAMYYMLTLIIIPTFFDHSKWYYFSFAIIISTLLIVIGWNTSLTLLADYITIHKSTIPDIPNTYGGYILEAIQMYVPGLILLSWESYEEQEAEAERLHQLEKDQITNELKYLKTQLNPQFLFNTLTNLKSFVEEKSPKAPDMIMRLSGMLDYILYKSQQKTVSVGEEIGVIEHFIGLERLRLGCSFIINLDIEGDTTIAIAPLTLLPLIESRLKESAVENREHSKLNIQISSSKNEIKCYIKSESPYSPLSDSLSAIRRQLEINYPNRHSLNESTHAGLSKIELTINPSYV